MACEPPNPSLPPALPQAVFGSIYINYPEPAPIGTNIKLYDSTKGEYLFIQESWTCSFSTTKGGYYDFIFWGVYAQTQNYNGDTIKIYVNGSDSGYSFIYEDFQVWEINIGAPIIPPPLTIINVNSTPTGANVYLDSTSNYIGKTNNSFEINPGSYVLILRLSGYDNYTEKFTIVEGETKTFDITLTPESPPPPEPPTPPPEEKKFPYWILLGIPLLIIPFIKKKKKKLK